MVSPVRFPRDAYASRWNRQPAAVTERNGGTVEVRRPRPSRCAQGWRPWPHRADSARSGRNRRPSPAVIITDFAPALPSGSRIGCGLRPGRLRPSSRHGSLSEADASSESLLRRLSRDQAEPRLADPSASLPSLRSGNEGKRKTGRADFGLPGVSPGRTPVSLRSDSPATLTRPGGIVGRSQPYDL